jgi:hypothetical protein
MRRGEEMRSGKHHWIAQRRRRGCEVLTREAGITNWKYLS